MTRFLREPLLHFLILGAVLFGLYGWINDSVLQRPNEIVVSRGQVQSLRAQFERVWQRPATPQELQGLVDNWIREEIFYREGLAMGLDRDDPVVRRRIGQKVEFIVDGMIPAAPTTAELQAWLDAHPGNYSSEARHSLRQIYFDPLKHGAQLESALTEARRALDLGRSVGGDATMLPHAVKAASTSEVGRTFGAEFADAIEALPVDSWQGPVRSGFGLHLVQVTERLDGRKATLQEVRDEVQRDVLYARAQEAADAFYERLRSAYVVRIDAATDIASDIVLDPAG